MARGSPSRGKCAYCGALMSGRGMAKHLTSCSRRQDAIDTANRGRADGQLLHHLQVQDAHCRDYWLHLEMRGSATLDQLDQYLRAIWLECCGHLSQFSIGGWGGKQVAKRRHADDVFEPGVTLTHIYDFGTSSETLVKAVAVRKGKALTLHPIALMARNEPPVFSCMECGQPARWLCLECVYDGEKTGTLCDEHAADHPHEDYGEPMPIVNSPRVGMCGYSGPADPLY